MNTIRRSARFFLLLVIILSWAVVVPAKDKNRRGSPPVIIIDPGHGGSSVAGSLKSRSNSSPNNAHSPSGLLEKDITLEFSKILEQQIFALAKRQQKAVTVVLTRTNDRNLNFAERAKICDRPNTACVVSIHFNASSGHNAKGSVAMISAQKKNPNYAVDKKFGSGLAAACSKGVKKYLPSTKSRGTITDGHLHGGLGSNFFFQLATKKRLARVPKCFLEVEFMDNPEVEKALLKGSGREAKFRHIAGELAKYLLANT